MKPAIKKLLALEDLKENWDSYGGLPMNKASKELATKVLGWIGEFDLPEPEVTLTSNGNVNCCWKRKNKLLEIEIGEGKIDVVQQEIGKSLSGDEGTPNFEMMGALARWLLA